MAGSQGRAGIQTTAVAPACPPCGCASPGSAMPDEGREMGTGLHGTGLKMAAGLVGAAGRSVPHSCDRPGGAVALGTQRPP